MTKNWEEHRAEIIRLYFHERWTLEDVMDFMRTKRRFKASRRSYHERLAKWGIRKNRRPEREADVHDPPTNGDDETGWGHQVNEADGGRQAESSTQQTQPQNGQSFVQPHLSEALHSQLAYYQHQHEVYTTQDWEYFDNAWLVQETSMQEDEPSMESQQQ